jgi:hypothetical protein
MKKKIITQLTGGLGNQLFQYAIAKSLSEKLKIPFIIDLSFFEYYEWHEYSLKPFNTQQNIISVTELNSYLNPKFSFLERVLFKLGFKSRPQSIVFEEKGFSYSDDVFDVEPSIYLKGFWQSEKYFLKIDKLIRSDFKINTPPSVINQNILDKINSSNAVSLHVRRGNYVTEEVFNSYHGTSSLEYYSSAVEFIKERIENPVFYIFSNDIPWSKEHLTFEGEKVFVDINDDKTDYEDLRLMSHCKHNIIANSTFSWWGAWLNENPEKIIIAPKRWFANEEMQAQTQDLIPESWIRL